jgi:hypothetical protein
MILKLTTDIAEMYSPPRVVEEAKKWGLSPGESMDLLTGWDFDREEHKEAARSYVKRVKPRLVIGSPMCRMFSSLRNLNKNKGSPEWEEEYKKAEKHVEFMMEIYKMQIDEGRLFLHEHPLTATSWKMDKVKKVASENGMKTTVADLCQYGMKIESSTGGGGAGRKTKMVKKPTKFMTNANEIVNELSKRCQGGHSHEHLVGGKAKAAEQYPKELCEAICRGLVKQLKMDSMKVKPLMRLTRLDRVGSLAGGLRLGRLPDNTPGLRGRQDPGAFPFPNLTCFRALPLLNFMD